MIFTGGTQARSRAVLTEGTSGRDGVLGSCPGPLWETRPCLAGPCLNFTWQIINGTVQCVRSDGLVVTGQYTNKLDWSWPRLTLMYFLFSVMCVKPCHTIFTLLHRCRRMRGRVASMSAGVHGAGVTLLSCGSLRLPLWDAAFILREAAVPSLQLHSHPQSDLPAAPTILWGEVLAR